MAVLLFQVVRPNYFEGEEGVTFLDTLTPEQRKPCTKVKLPWNLEEAVDPDVKMEEDEEVGYGEGHGHGGYDYERFQTGSDYPIERVSHRSSHSSES